MELEKTTGEPQLIQLKFRDEPWKMMVCCILLNKTSRRQVDVIIDEFFDWYPTPFELTDADDELEGLIKPLGLWRQRATRLRRFSEDWVRVGPDQTKDPDKTIVMLGMCRGVGKYAIDSYMMFALRRPDLVVPTDKELLRWLTWYESYGRNEHVTE